MKKYKGNSFKILKSGYCDAIISQGDKLSEFNTDSLSKLGTFYNRPIRMDFLTIIQSLNLNQLVKQIKVSKDVLFGLESQIGKCAESAKKSVSTIQKIITGLNNLQSFSSITGLSVFNEVRSEFEDFQMNQSEVSLIMNAMTRQIAISMERLIIDNSTRKG